ncbi:hypothetical protein LTR62_002704 [Meristemomyces frigidus]|uniref:Uncharacterized protein n=1 Tax=Meristemomyces frigidus TaxID=1508187 RepID=A0AAN7YQ16_9PEZI|nr:hypothetical protein LTR62_002704 [Meristemomyces frigidus]
MNATVVVLCVIVGCGVTVLMGWALTHRLFPSDVAPPEDADGSQARYMREVRLRHHDDLAAGLGARAVLEHSRRNQKASMYSDDSEAA